ncbi:hypothetical protein CROQUDRAFT_595195 [Cronartium quercuum f. sp. fusiforme G11]|uniref:Uncharacterized protein n=1 Tax=Cronartium quercuum f. sp. fusiforme G11 TaxID=708437 RepID=A0A9P6TAA4_9BASI|nr:hypothetical protein CROQUDRAFT_595195 [Cronartium quercuum f. sp. fusiforme G11]
MSETELSMTSEDDLSINSTFDDTTQTPVTQAPSKSSFELMASSDQLSTSTGGDGRELDGVTLDLGPTGSLHLQPSASESSIHTAGPIPLEERRARAKALAHETLHPNSACVGTPVLGPVNHFRTILSSTTVVTNRSARDSFPAKLRKLSKSLAGLPSSLMDLTYFPGTTSKLKGAASLLSRSACQIHLANEIVKTVSVVVENSNSADTTSGTASYNSRDSLSTRSISPNNLAKDIIKTVSIVVEHSALDDATFTTINSSNFGGRNSISCGSAAQFIPAREIVKTVSVSVQYTPTGSDIAS